MRTEIQAPDMRFVAERLIGLTEIKGGRDDPLIVALHWYGAQAPWFNDDETPWCSSSMCAVARISGRLNPVSARARSWLHVGQPLSVDDWLGADAEVRYNSVAVLKQSLSDPGPEVIKYRGHVGMPVSFNSDVLSLLAGNQGNQFNVKEFPIERLMGIRYLPFIL